jgi:hypothetical protein
MGKAFTTIVVVVIDVARVVVVTSIEPLPSMELLVCVRSPMTMGSVPDQGARFAPIATSLMPFRPTTTPGLDPTSEAALPCLEAAPPGIDPTTLGEAALPCNNAIALSEAELPGFAEATISCRDAIAAGDRVEAALPGVGTMSPCMEAALSGRDASALGEAAVPGNRPEAALPGNPATALGNSMASALPGIDAIGLGDNAEAALPSNVEAVPLGNIEAAPPGNVEAEPPGNVEAAPLGNVEAALPGNVEVAPPGKVEATSPGIVEAALPGKIEAAPGRVEAPIPGNVEVAPSSNDPVALGVERAFSLRIALEVVGVVVLVAAGVDDDRVGSQPERSLAMSMLGMEPRSVVTVSLAMAA